MKQQLTNNQTTKTPFTGNDSYCDVSSIIIHHNVTVAYSEFHSKQI